MAKFKPVLTGGIGESEPQIFQDPHIKYLEHNVRFSFKYLKIGSNYCISHLDDRELEKLFDRLSHFEDMTWKLASQIPREKGFSVEKRGDSNYSLLKAFCDAFDTFLHFRVNGTDKAFRVFGARHQDLCYIMLLDNEGEINH